MLSAVQRPVLAAQQLAPLSPVFNLGMLMRLRDPISRERARALLDWQQARYSQWRVAIVRAKGRVVQRACAASISLQVVDLGDLDDEAFRAELRALQSVHFALDTGPLVRAALVQRGARQYLFFIVHHLVCDGYAIMAGVGDVAAFLDDRDPGPTGAPYAAFIEEEAALVDKNPLRVRAFWDRVQARPSPPVLEVDRPRPKLDGPPKIDPPVHASLDGEVLAAIERAARDAGHTLFSRTLASCFVLMDRLAPGPHQIAIPLRNRSRRFRRTMGHFVNHAPICVDVDRTAPFDDLVDDVAREVKRALRAQSLPNPHAPPPIALSWVSESSRIDTGELPVVIEHIEQLGAPELLAFAGYVFADRFDLELRYDAARLDEQSARALLDAQLEILRGARHSPVTVAALPWTREEPSPPVEPVDDEDIAVAFARCAVANPSATALVDDNGTLTYRQLEEQSAAIARGLVARGLRSARVGIGLKMSRDAAVMALATLRAGAAYVPIDPSLDADARRERLEATGVTCVVDDAADLQMLVDEGAGHELPREHPPHREAYLAFTSGSTGHPKAVVVTRANLAVSTAARRAVYPTPRRVLVTSPLHFDGAVAALWWSLVVGGSVVIPRPGISADPTRIAHAVRDNAVEHLFMIPSLHREVLRELDMMPEARSLLHVVVAAEVCPVDLVELHARVLPLCTLTNEYGPTETTVWASYHHAYSAGVVHVDAGGRVPIGVAPPGYRVLVADDEGREVPLGAPGEIVVEGRAVARYNSQSAPPARYVTGDRARVRRDGLLDFLGRRDRQRKVRGVRVDLEGIEALAIDRPEIHDAAAVVVGQQIVLYVVADDGIAALPEAFSMLPRQVRPSRIIALEQLPRIASGKVDLEALSARTLPSTRDLGAAPRVAPRTAIEQTIAETILSLAPATPISVRDNLLTLGFDSLQAARLIGRLHALFGDGLSLSGFFAEPTIEGLATLASRAAHDDKPRPISRDVPPKRAPASAAQARMWFHHRLDPEGVAYSMPFAIRVSGPLDVDALRAAFHDVVERHTLLRTVFKNAPAGLEQVLTDDRGRFVLEDLRELPHEDARARARERADSDAGALFDLEDGPMVQLRAIRLTDDETLLVMNMHHIVGDQWSYGILLWDLSALYRAHKSGDIEDARTDQVQFVHANNWIRERLTGGAEDEMISRWRERLAGLRDIDLPTDHPRPTVRSSRGGLVYETVDDDFIARLRAFSATEESTPFMALLAGYAALLSIWSRTEDLAVAVPVAAREHPDFERVIGPFVNTVPMRMDTSGAPSFRELLGRARHVALSAFRDQSLPFERLVDELEIARDPSRTPLVQVMLNLGNVPAEDNFPSELQWETHDLSVVGAQFDLTVGADFIRQKRVGLVFARDLFEHETARRFLSQFVKLLRAGLAAPDTPVRDLEIIAPSESHALVTTWNDTARNFSDDATVANAFRSAAEEDPAREALVCAGARLTYGEVSARADQIARALLSLGVSHGDHVAVLLERNLELIPTLHAIWRVGAAYVPLDPHYPKARVESCVRRAQIKVVVAGDDVEVPGDVHALRLSEVARTDVEPVENRARAEDTAYVIFTSGSTGEPKGVVVQHSALHNFIASMAERPGFDDDDRLLAVTTVAFDIHGLELHLPLTRGGAVVLATEDEQLDGRALVELLTRERITVMQATPATWRLMLDARWPEGENQLSVLCGGEPFPGELCVPLNRRAARVWNMYGPTETTIWSTMAEVAEVPLAPDIGRPIANTTCYVLDGARRLVPRGVAGELYIGGTGVARGYLNAPELTAAAFFDDPFSDEDGARIYKTGDLVRQASDGALICMGRIDQQLKVRGFRIEPGEIEVALIERAGLRAAAVVAQKDNSGVAFLSAFYEADSPRAANELKAALTDVVPAYMIPARLTHLEALPLTPNGKVDRRALVEIEAQKNDDDGERVAPRSDLERGVAGAWCEVLDLDVEHVSVEANFFELGGQSIAAARLAMLLSERMSIALPLHSLFASPTIAGLAEVVADLTSGKALGKLSLLFAVQPGDGETPLFIVGGAHQRDELEGTYEQDLLRYFANLIGALGPKIPVYGFRPLGLFHDEEPETSVPKIAARYIDEIKSVQAEGPYRIAGECVGGYVAHEIAQQLEARGEEVETLLLLDTVAPSTARVFSETFWWFFFHVYRVVKGETSFSPLRRLRTAWTRFSDLARRGKVARAYRFTDYYHFFTLLKFRPRPTKVKLTLVANEVFMRRHIRLGWSHEVARDVELHEVPGDHVTRLSEHGDVIGQKVRTILSR